MLYETDILSWERKFHRIMPEMLLSITRLQLYSLTYRVGNCKKVPGNPVKIFPGFRQIILIGLFCYGALVLSAQTPGVHDVNKLQQTQINVADSTSTDTLVVRYIEITGNKRTKPKIIYREIPITPGKSYTVNQLFELFTIAEQQLMNTALFHEARLSILCVEGKEIEILVTVKERWYYFVFPHLKPIDRNINQWLIEQNARLNRVDIGVKAMVNNTTGTDDKLRVWFIGGYSRQAILSYTKPYISADLKWGFNIAASYGQNREVNYITSNNKQAFLKDDDYLRKYLTANAEVIYRPGMYTRHRFGIGFTHEIIADTVLQRNPNYFFKGNAMNLPEVYYKVTRNYVDYIPYPKKGYTTEFEFRKKGVSKTQNLWLFSIRGAYYKPLWDNAFMSFSGFSEIKLPFRQPFYFQRMLGYGPNTLQGLEYYVIDGVWGGYFKTSMHQRLFSFSVPFPMFKTLFPQKIPFTVYAKAYANSGYVHNPNSNANSYSNKMLYTGGIGLDVTSLYDFTLRLEWSFNQFGQNGLYLHNKSTL